jgi:polar amino acid transport system substrate-binding protein
MRLALAQFLTTRRRLIGAGALLALIVGIGLTLGIGPAQVKDTGWARIQLSGTMRIGMDASYPPFESLDATTGQPVGFDVDLTQEIGQRLGVKPSITNIAYDGLYDALVTDKVDVLISALADLPQAQGKIAFSQPYFNAGEMLVVKTGSPIHSMNDLDNRLVAVEYGSGGDVEARKWQRRLPDLQLKRYPDPESALKAVSSGEADAAIVDGIAAALAVGHGTDLAAGPHLVDTLFGAAVASRNDILLEKLNQTIQSMFKDGTIDFLTRKWFGPQKAISSP